MDEEIKKLLEENLEISKESLKILKGIQRKNRIAFLFKTIYWILLIFALYYGYQSLQPYFQSIQQSLDSLKNFPQLKF
jgi:hypothetical protein